MAHVSSVIRSSDAAILKARRLNAPTHLRLRSQARSGPVEGKAWAVLDALYATVGPLILRDATIYAEHRLGVKGSATASLRKKLKALKAEPIQSVPTIKPDDLIAALRQYECFPVEYSTHGGMSSTRKNEAEEEGGDPEDQPADMDLAQDEDEEKKKKQQRAERKQAKKIKKEKRAAAAAAASDE